MDEDTGISLPVRPSACMNMSTGVGFHVCHLSSPWPCGKHLHSLETLSPSSPVPTFAASQVLHIKRSHTKYGYTVHAPALGKSLAGTRVHSAISPGPAVLRRGHCPRQGDPAPSSTTYPPPRSRRGRPPSFCLWSLPARVLIATLAGWWALGLCSTPAPTHTQPALVWLVGH
jgi:hypothetical protein